MKLLLCNGTPSSVSIVDVVVPHFSPAGNPGHGPAPIRLTEVVVILWANATFCHLLLCISVMFFFSYGVLQWLPTFFIRSYGLTSGQVGSLLALTVSLGGIVGIYFGGDWASRHAASDERLQLRFMTMPIIACGVLSAPQRIDIQI